MNEISPLLQTVDVTHIAVPSVGYASGLPPADPAHPANWFYREGFAAGGPLWPPVSSGSLSTRVGGSRVPAFSVRRSLMSRFLASDPAGDVAMSYSYGGPTASPSSGAMVLSGPATGSVDVIRGEVVSPSAGIDRAHGDYSSVQPDGARSRGLIAAGYAALNDSDGPHDRWNFVRFGFGG